MFLTIGLRDGRRDVQRDDERIALAVGELRDALASHPEVAWLRSGPDDSDLEQVWKLYFPARFGLISLNPERDIPELLTLPAIEAKAEQARNALASPAGVLVKRTLPADPLGFFVSTMERLRDDNPSMEVRGGTLFSGDGYGVILLATKSSAFNASRQAPLLDHIGTSFAAIRARHGDDLVLEKSGANRFSVDAERSMRRDMGWIAGTSMLGIALLVLIYFQSAWRFAVALLPSVAGLLLATALGIVVFGHLDGLTLAFGATLIGVTIDYPIHLLNHLAMVGDRKSEAVRTLAPTLAMGALTTIASFAGMTLTSFPGFREIGFFAAVGVAGALATTLLAVPLFLGEGATTTRPLRATARVLSAAMRSALGHRRLLMAVPLAVALLGAVMLPRLRWQDDLSKLGNMDPALEQEERRVHDRVAPFEAGRVVVAMADDEQHALELGEDIARRMEKLRGEGAIGGFRSPSALVWSNSLQRRNLAALAAAPDLFQRVRAGFATAGFRATALDAFEKDASAAMAGVEPAAGAATRKEGAALLEAGFATLKEPPLLLTADAVQQTTLGRMLNPMFLRMNGRYAVLTQVSDPRDEDAVRREIAAVPGAHYFVQRDFVNDFFAQFRDTTLQQLLLGGVLVIGVLALRYRSWRRTAAAFLPSALVPVVMLSGMAMVGEPVHLLHVISLLIVTGIGVDYGIFLVDSAGNRAQHQATLVSLLLCCLTTVLGFAVVAVSTHPALRAMGMTIGCGVTLSLLMSPVSLLLIREEQGPAPGDVA